jgi:hypothetical protein
VDRLKLTQQLEVHPLILARGLEAIWSRFVKRTRDGVGVRCVLDGDDAVVEAYAGVVPDPGEVQDLAGLIEALNLLRMASGNPSFRALARSVGKTSRPPHALAHTTVRDLFQTRRRRLDIDLLVATVRALGLSDSEAARWRQACARVQVEAKFGALAAVLRQLPAATAVFTGRERELEDVLKPAVAGSDRQAGDAAVISAIDGMAGVGKTQLALHAAHELVRSGRFTDAQLYVDLRGFDADHPPADPAAVLATFLRQLGVATRHIPEAWEERAAMFRDRMHDRAALVLLDNAADEAQIRTLIPASPSCLVLVTSRRSLAGLEGAALRTLDVFSRAESVALLANVAGTDRVEAEPETAAAIVEACGFLPLAITLAGSRLRARPTWTLADLAHRLRTTGLDAFSAGNRALRPVLDLSYRALPPSAQRLLCLLSLLPDGDFTSAAAASVAGTSAAETDEVLERLEDEHLLQRTTNGRYRLHDLIHGYAAELVQTESSPDQPRAASRRLAAGQRTGTDGSVPAAEPVRPGHSYCPRARIAATR